MVWPLYFARGLSLGSPETSGLALCLLWTPQERVVPLLDPASFAVAGNLYSREGISFLVRNILAHPTLSTLLLCGKDLTGAGAALAALWQSGLAAGHRVAGDGARLHPEIPAEAVDLLRRSVRLVDRRDTAHPQAVAALARELACPAQPFAPPQAFPYREPAPATLPAEGAGTLVRAPTVREGYLAALWHVMRLGQPGATQHGPGQRELIDLLAVIDEEPTDPAAFSHAAWMPFERASLGGRGPDGRFTGYLGQFLEAGLPPGVSYTYGERLRAFGPRQVDQVAAIIADLRAAGESRRAVAALWEPARDPGSPSPPCLNLVQARLRGGRLHLAAYFRSHDIYRAWAANAYGLRALQGLIAAELGAGAAELTVHSHSAHVYAHDWEAAEELLAHHHRPADPRFKRDPRGSFVVAVEDAELAVHHYSPAGEHLQTFRAATARELAPRLAPYLSEMGHALYLGGELQKAELALRLGRPEAYRQDRALEL